MKGKAVPVQPWRLTGRCTADVHFLILSLSTRWRWLINFAPQPSHLREGIPVYTEHEDGWALQHVRTLCRTQKSLSLAGNQTIFDFPFDYSKVQNYWMQAGEPENAGRLKQSCEFCIKFRLYIEYMVTARVSRISSIIYLFIYVLPNEVISSEGAGRNLP